MIQEEGNLDHLTELKKNVDKNPFDREKFIELINVLREGNSETEKEWLEFYRRTFSIRFVCDLEFWMNWLNDYIISCQGKINDETFLLFDKVLECYPHIDIVNEFIDFLERNYEEDYITDEVLRNTFEKSVATVGLDLLNASVIWKRYREFEYEEYEDIVETSSDQSLIIKSKERVIKLFRRQLSIPLLGNESTLREFDKVLSDICTANDEKLIDPISLQKNYTQALDEKESRMIYESHLISDTYLESSELEKLKSWKTYIDFEMQEKKYIRVQRLYERAVLDLPLNLELWKDYMQFVLYQLKNWKLLNLVTERAVIPCNYDVNIWKYRLWAMELNDMTTDKMTSVIQTAIQFSFKSAEDYLQLYYSLIDYSRRRLTKALVGSIDEDAPININELSSSSTADVIRGIHVLRHSFQETETFLSTYYPSWTSAFLTMIEYRSKLEDTVITKAIQSLDEDLGGPGMNLTSDMNDIWEAFVKNNHKNGVVWMAYLQWAQTRLRYQVGEVSTTQTRKLFQRALASGVDCTQEICQLWVDFEREFGSLQNLIDTQAKVQKKLSQLVPKQQPVPVVSVESVESEEPGKLNRKERRAKGEFAPTGRINPVKEAVVAENKPVTKKRKLEQSLDGSINNIANGNNGSTSRDEAGNGHKREDHQISEPMVLSHDDSSFVESTAQSPQASSLLVSDGAQTPHMNISSSYSQRPETFLQPEATTTSSSSSCHEIFVKNLPFRTTEEELKKVLEERLSQATTGAGVSDDVVGGSGRDIKGLFVSIVRDSAGKSRGLAHVRFLQEYLFQQAQQLKDVKISNRLLVIEKYGGAAITGHSERAMDPCTVFIEGLPVSANIESLKALFGSVGEILEARVVIDPTTGKNKGHGLVQFKSPSVLQEALMKDWSLDSKKLSVSQSWYPAVQPVKSIDSHKNTPQESKSMRVTPAANSTIRVSSQSTTSFKPRKLNIGTNTTARLPVKPKTTKASPNDEITSNPPKESEGGVKTNADFKKFFT